MKEKRVCLRVYGRVQGVFFRAFTRQEALKRGLRGFVINRPDATVYIEAEGEEERLVEFIARVKEGPPASRVRNLEIEWCEPAGFEDFQIRY